MNRSPLEQYPPHRRTALWRKGGMLQNRIEVGREGKSRSRSKEALMRQIQVTKICFA
jgi:hypothetical protein